MSDEYKLTKKILEFAQQDVKEEKKQAYMNEIITFYVPKLKAVYDKYRRNKIAQKSAIFFPRLTLCSSNVFRGEVNKASKELNRVLNANELTCDDYDQGERVDTLPHKKNLFYCMEHIKSRAQKKKNEHFDYFNRFSRNSRALEQ